MSAASSSSSIPIAREAERGARLAPAPSTTPALDEAPRAEVVRFPKEPRRVALDATRVLATFGVIWVHVAEVQGHPPHVAALGRYGTSFYVLAVVLFALQAERRHPGRSLAEDTKFRAERLLVPFVAWSLVYGAFYGFHAFVAGHTFRDLAQWWGPFAGTARHLWFLPFAFATGLGISRVAPRLRRASTEWLVFSATVGSFGVFLICYRYLFFSFPRLLFIDLHLHRFDRWIEELPLVFAAAVCGVLADRHERAVARFTERFAWAFVGLGVLGFVAVEKLYFDHFDWLKEVTGTEGRYLANFGGLFLFSIAVGLSRSRFVRRLAPLGRFTYFAFLAHVLVLDVVNESLFALPGFGRPEFAFATSIAILGTCLGLGALFRKTRALRWFAP